MYIVMLTNMLAFCRATFIMLTVLELVFQCNLNVNHNDSCWILTRTSMSCMIKYCRRWSQCLSCACLYDLLRVDGGDDDAGNAEIMETVAKLRRLYTPMATNIVW